MVHLNAQSVVDACLHAEAPGRIAYENTSRRVSPKTYIPLLYGKRLVLDTSHIYSSGLAKTPQDALELIKHLSNKASIVAIHLND